MAPETAIQMSAPDFLRRLKVFKPDDLIWIGRKTSSGAPIHRIHFRTLAQWKASPPPPGWCYTAGAVFRPGSFSRSKSNVLAVRALILESDSLPLRETFAMARWVEDEFSVPLLACVHSGGKSLHCYFKHPDPNFKHGWVDQWGPALAAAGFDRRTLSAAATYSAGRATTGRYRSHARAALASARKNSQIKIQIIAHEVCQTSLRRGWPLRRLP